MLRHGAVLGTAPVPSGGVSRLYADGRTGSIAEDALLRALSAVLDADPLIDEMGLMHMPMPDPPPFVCASAALYVSLRVGRRGGSYTPLFS